MWVPVSLPPSSTEFCKLLFFVPRTANSICESRTLLALPLTYSLYWSLYVIQLWLTDTFNCNHLDVKLMCIYVESVNELLSISSISLICNVILTYRYPITPVIFDSFVACIFPVRSFFWAHGITSLPSPIVTKFCILGCQGTHPPSGAMHGQRLVLPVPHWTEMLDQLIEETKIMVVVFIFYP